MGQSFIVKRALKEPPMKITSVKFNMNKNEKTLNRFNWTIKKKLIKELD